MARQTALSPQSWSMAQFKISQTARSQSKTGLAIVVRFAVGMKYCNALQ